MSTMTMSEPAVQLPKKPGAIEALHPAYFAMVMATGIVSIAALFTGYRAIAVGMFYANIVFYLVLVGLTIVRVARFPARVGKDLSDHGRSVGFFTTIAGTCVLGSQFNLVGGMPAIAVGLWFAGIGLWIILTYTVFASLTLKSTKPSLASGINGGWLVAVVAPQSICVLGAPLAGWFGPGRELALFTCLSFWLAGGMLYIWIISLIFYRYTFFELRPSDLAPPYWINMGAVAISTLAGTVLIGAAQQQAGLLRDLLPFLKGFTLLFWATATLWIPMLLILGVWRHVVMRFPLRYDALYWGAVFPLGMYTVCTFRLAHAVDSPFLLGIPRVFVFVALAAWCATFVGLLLILGARLRPRAVAA